MSLMMINGVVFLHIPDRGCVESRRSISLMLTNVETIFVFVFQCFGEF